MQSQEVVIYTFPCNFLIFLELILFLFAWFSMYLSFVAMLHWSRYKHIDSIFQNVNISNHYQLAVFMVAIFPENSVLHSQLDWLIRRLDAQLPLGTSLTSSWKFSLPLSLVNFSLSWRAHPLASS